MNCHAPAAKPEDIRHVDELKRDLARTHRTTRTSYEGVQLEGIDADYARLMRDGYVIIETLLAPDQLQKVRAAAGECLGPTGRNSFEGKLTQRVYDVFSKTRSVDALAEHPRVLGLLDRLFLPNYLLSQAQIINILPGSEPQLLHHDDGAYPIPRPRKALGAATIWAIDDFTAQNGSTVVVPGSHTWDDHRTPIDGEPIPCVMSAGSVVVFLGTLWHGGGRNFSQESRLAVTCQYCEPWLRQQENFMSEVPLSIANTLSEDLLRMIGYSVLPPFFGMVNGMHPKRLLSVGREGEFNL
ncbi:ectoine hydroxylase-related dioxygenase (phytanoyl-CoA dioxygenase family) [Variovorax paradoxus]|uniref:phytanoyl-CoA dioxygenase family protein n=1 Tax=Variovorax paradoxus TaxID=34073 RepID=UPI00277FF184|nr:phytanoyl-CoA dioxygenase family protein [Variovorax paradoxus]MDP9962879.1 ectoine hydroxylase-related dioxygenase (phytanoyl-CoA dioxygenase family) [Variovorax paradoxus]